MTSAIFAAVPLSVALTTAWAAGHRGWSLLVAAWFGGIPLVYWATDPARLSGVLNDSVPNVALLAAVLLLGEAVRSRRALALEQERSERLLLNVLPATVAARLKQRQDVIADGFPDVTVLFADLVDFTRRSERIAPEQVVQEGTTYSAEVQTSCGTIVIELLADRAPETVNSFVFLAQKGYFDGQRIHRLDTSIDVIQGGDPTGTGSGGPGYTIPDELTGDESYDPGVLAMANSGADSGGSQFFIITGDAGHGLDSSPDYTIFGMVVEGLDVAKRIQELPIQDPSTGIAGQQPKQSVYIEKVTIREGG